MVFGDVPDELVEAVGVVKVSVPEPGGRLASGSVRDDTVSIDGPVPVTALRSAFVTLMVSFLRV